MSDGNNNLNNQNVSSSENNSNINQEKTPKYRAKNSSLDNGNSNNIEYRNDNNSGEKTKEEIKAENDAANTEAVKIGADFASKSSHPVVAAIGNVVKRNPGLQKAAGKITTQANKLAPFAQTITNKLAESEAAKNAAKAIAAKNGDASSVGEDAAKNKAGEA